MIGIRLGPYEITAKLGEGGMGQVFRARDFQLGRDVALKVLPEGFTSDLERLARFEREAKLLAQLNHPNIAQIYGFEASGDTRALVMELVEGPTLAERLEQGPLPFSECLTVSVQIAQALEEAHEKGIVHRDLKPQNIKASIEGKVKVLDFGLAKALDAGSGFGAAVSLANSPTVTFGGTREGVILGTAAYMAPEQARGLAVDKRADIWSFGVVLFEMLAGRAAFGAATIPDTLAAVLTREVDWSALPGSTPPALRRLLERCLERDPKNRLHDIADARLELATAIAESTRRSISPASPASGRSRRGLLVRAGAGIAIALLVGAGIGVGFERLRSTAGRPSRDLPGVSFTQKTFRRQPIFNARFAPDGKTIVFSAALSGSTPALFVIRPEYPEPQPLGLNDTHLLAVSSKGELAVLTGARYILQRLFSGTLARVPLGGGAPRELARDVREADWTPDGSELAVVRQVEGKDRLELPPGTLLYEYPGYLSDLRVAPDGRSVAFFEHPTPFDDRGRVAVVERSGKVTLRTDSYVGVEGLAWSANGEEIIYSAYSDSGQEVFAVRHGQAPVRVLATAGNARIQDVSREGRWLVARDELTFSLRVRAPGAAEERDLSWLDQSLLPHLSSDGRLLVFTDEGVLAGPNYAVMVRKTDGSPAFRLGEGEGSDLSPDHRFVLARISTTPAQLVLYPLGAGEARRLDHGELESVTSAYWFPDGAAILACGNEPGRALRCYRLEISTGDLRPVTPEGFSTGFVSPRGDELLVRQVTGSGYVLISIAGGSPRPVPGLTADDRVVRWSPDGRSLWVRKRREIPARIEDLDLASGLRRPLLEIAPRDLAGLMSLDFLSLADDPAVYAYTPREFVSQLFEVDGAR